MPVFYSTGLISLTCDMCKAAALAAILINATFSSQTLE